MRTDDFWLIVQGSGGRSADPDFLAELSHALQRGGDASIAGFERHVREQVNALDTLEIRDVADQLWVLNDEQWLHLRAWCVTQGREFVSELAERPGRVLRRVADGRAGPFDPPSGEVLLDCADLARVAAETR